MTEPRKRTPASWLFWALKQRMDSPISQLLLIVLGDLADENGTTWATHLYLAERCRCCERTIDRHMNSLEALGLVKVKRRSKMGKKISNLSTLQRDHEHAHATLCQESNDSASLPGTDTKSHKTPTKKTLPRHTSDSFDMFWKIYPVKRNKAGSRGIFESQNLSGELNIILEDIRKRIEVGEWNIHGDSQRYIPYPSTYLRDRRWEDEPTQPQNPSPSSEFRPQRSTRNRPIQQDLEDTSWADGITTLRRSK